MKTLSVTLICKNEQNNLTRLLPTLSFADEIIVADTGSSDDTVSVAEKHGCKTYLFEWRDDFSAARNYAIEKATCDYIMWLDADDAVTRSAVKEIERFKNDGNDNADVYFMKYRMGAKSEFWFYRERIVKRCKKCRFKGFIHEVITPFGHIKYLDSEIVHTSCESHEKRNLDIYKRALNEGMRFSLRDKYYYARTLVENGMFADAEPILTKFKSERRAYAPDRVAACKLLARQYIADNDADKALKALSYGAKIIPPDAETCCLLGDCYFCTGNYSYAAQWYEFAETSKIQVGFVNGYYKSFYPNIQLSVCYYRLGNMAKAQFYHRLAKAIDPDHPSIKANDKYFAKRKN